MSNTTAPTSNPFGYTPPPDYPEPAAPEDVRQELAKQQNLEHSHEAI